MSDAQFYFSWCKMSEFKLSWYQTFDFVFVDFYLILLHHKTLFSDNYKEKIRRGYSQEIEKDKSTKDVAA